MMMPENDREIFKYLSADEASPTQIDMMAFALFFFEKEEWCNQFEEKNKKPPSQQEIDGFTADYTTERLKRLKHDAAIFFDAAARDYLEDEIEEERRKVLEAEIVREVKRSGGFWRQFGLAVITSILAPLALALMLLTGSFVKDIPSPNDIISRFPAGHGQPKSTQEPGGEKSGNTTSQTAGTKQ